jgi:hypothetical protein
VQNVLFAFEPSKYSETAAENVKSSYLFLVTNYVNVTVSVFLPPFSSSFFNLLDNIECTVVCYSCMDNTESHFLNNFTNGFFLSSTAQEGAP